MVQPVSGQIPIVDDDGKLTSFGLQFLNGLATALNGSSQNNINTAQIGGLTVITGSGSPVGVVSASPGALYISTAGGSHATLWVKESGTSAAGWIGK